MMFLLGAIGTVYSVYKDLKSVFCAFSSEKTLQRYKDRTDETKDKIDGFISKIKGNSFETNAVRVDLPEIKDFLLLSKHNERIVTWRFYFSFESERTKNRTMA